MNAPEAKTETKRYESTKVLTDDKSKIEKISSDTGLAEIDSVGAALEGWDKLPKKTRERIVLNRLRRPNRSKRCVSSAVAA